MDTGVGAPRCHWLSGLPGLLRAQQRSPDTCSSSFRVHRSARGRIENRRWYRRVLGAVNDLAFPASFRGLLTLPAWRPHTPLKQGLPTSLPVDKGIAHSRGHWCTRCGCFHAPWRSPLGPQILTHRLPGPLGSGSAHPCPREDPGPYQGCLFKPGGKFSHCAWARPPESDLLAPGCSLEGPGECRWAIGSLRGRPGLLPTLLPPHLFSP